MAILRSPRREFLAPCRSLIGRSPVAELQLESRHASTEHAALQWKGARWLIRDLGSRNGTTLNRQSLQPGKDHSLLNGDELRFGGSEESWVAENTSPPDPCAVLLATGKVHWGTGDLLLLPSEHEPEASAFRDGGSWWIDHDGTQRPVQCRDVVELGGGRARLFLPDSVESLDTAAIDDELDIERTELVFRVSQDEESVVVTVRQAALARELPSRACLYTLLLLARARLADQRPESDRGWLAQDELADQLKATSEKVNVDIHRIRKLFQESGVRNALRIIERRADSRRLRIGCASLTLERM